MKHLGMYQTSNFCTETFDALCHLEDEIQRYGIVRQLDVGLFKNRHIILEEENRVTPQRCPTCREE